MALSDFRQITLFIRCQYSIWLVRVRFNVQIKIVIPCFFKFVVGELTSPRVIQSAT